MNRNFKKRDQDKRFYRTNERIFGREFRVLDSENKQIGILGRDEALNLAREQGLDLVEIAAQAQPPVVKIVDFNKFLYQQEKKKQEEKKKAKTSDTKEVRLGPFIGEADLEVVLRKVRGFLEDGDKVRLVVRFRGRQITHPEFGQQVIQKVIDNLFDISKVDREPHLEGKQMIALMSPDKKGKNAEEKNQEFSEQALQDN